MMTFIEAKKVNKQKLTELLVESGILKTLSGLPSPQHFILW